MSGKDKGVSLNQPRCPVCNTGLKIGATVAHGVRAECPKCGWEWRG